jgi:hypothetical protein
MLRDAYGQVVSLVAPKRFLSPSMSLNVLHGLSASADGVEAAFSSAGISLPSTAFITLAMGRKRLRVFSLAA